MLLSTSFQVLKFLNKYHYTIVKVKTTLNETHVPQCHVMYYFSIKLMLSLHTLKFLPPILLWSCLS